MISLDHKLRKIDDFLVVTPNVAIRVKFADSDNYRNFEAGNVTNDTFCDTVASGVVFADPVSLKNDTHATLERHFSFSDCFKINALQSRSDTQATLGEGKCRLDYIATAERQTRTPFRGVRLYASDAPSVDWADLGEREFEAALQTITSVDELCGLANRRRVLQRDCKKWNAAQRGRILSRKFILENANA